jgi:hypothetical protein
MVDLSQTHSSTPGNRNLSVMAMTGGGRRDLRAAA